MTSRLVSRILSFIPRHLSQPRRFIQRGHQVVISSFQRPTTRIHSVFWNHVFKPHVVIIPSVLLGGIALKNVSNELPDNSIKFLKAVKFGTVQEVAAMLAAGVNPDSRHPLGWTALHVAAVNGRADVVEALLKAGANPNAPGEQHKKFFYFPSTILLLPFQRSTPTFTTLRERRKFIPWK